VSFPSRTCSSLSLTAESYLIKTTNRDGMVLQHVREAPAGLPFPTGYPASCHVFLRSYGRMYIHAYLAFGLDNVAMHENPIWPLIITYTYAQSIIKIHRTNAPRRVECMREAAEIWGKF
jgi:hypothetical protein